MSGAEGVDEWMGGVIGEFAGLSMIGEESSGGGGGKGSALVESVHSRPTRGVRSAAGRESVGSDLSAGSLEHLPSRASVQSLVEGIVDGGEAAAKRVAAVGPRFGTSIDVPGVSSGVGWPDATGATSVPAPVIGDRHARHFSLVRPAKTSPETETDTDSGEGSVPGWGWGSPWTAAPSGPEEGPSESWELPPAVAPAREATDVPYAMSAKPVSSPSYSWGERAHSAGDLSKSFGGAGGRDIGPHMHHHHHHHPALVKYPPPMPGSSVPMAVHSAGMSDPTLGGPPRVAGSWPGVESSGGLLRASHSHPHRLHAASAPPFRPMAPMPVAPPRMMVSAPPPGLCLEGLGPAPSAAALAFAPSGSKASRSKTRLCRYYVSRNNNHFGRTCTYLHPCRDLLVLGACSHGSRCTDDHVCRDQVWLGACHSGPACPYHHLTQEADIRELRDRFGGWVDRMGRPLPLACMGPHAYTPPRTVDSEAPGSDGRPGCPFWFSSTRAGCKAGPDCPFLHAGQVQLPSRPMPTAKDMSFCVAQWASRRKGHLGPGSAASAPSPDTPPRDTRWHDRKRRGRRPKPKTAPAAVPAPEDWTSWPST